MTSSKYNGVEKRKGPRLDIRFVVSYKIIDPNSSFDISLTKNISQGGILLTTNRFFDVGTQLEMKIKFPFYEGMLKVIGEVVHCKEKVRGLIYETRVRFLNLDKNILEDIGHYINRFITNKK